MNRIEIAIYFTIIPWFHDSMNDWRVIMMKWESDKGRSHGNGCYINIKNYLWCTRLWGNFWLFILKRKKKGENFLYAFSIRWKRWTVISIIAIYTFFFGKINFIPATNSLVSKNIHIIPSYCFVLITTIKGLYTN